MNSAHPGTEVAVSSERASDDGGFTVFDALKVIADNLRLLIVVPVVIGVTAYGISWILPPSYKASVRFLPPQQQASAASAMIQSLGALGSLAGAASGLKNPTDQYVAFLKTRSVQDGLVDRFNLLERYDKEYRQDAREVLAKNSKIDSGKENIVTVEFTDRDPKFAADVANGYVAELGRVLNSMAVTEAQQRRVFFEKQLLSTKDALIKAEQALAASGVGTSALNASPTTALEAPARLRAQIAVLEVKIASMRSYLTNTAPELRQAVAELSALRGQLSKSEQQRPATSGSGNDYIATYREFKYQETLFEMFSKQFEIAKIDESREGAVIQVIDRAEAPERKSGPRRLLIAGLAVLISAFFILVYIFTQRAFRAEKASPVSAQKINDLKRSFGRGSVGR